MAYQAFILLPSDSDVSIEKVRQILENYFAKKSAEITFESEENTLTMTVDDWDCNFSLNSKPFVIEESKDLAKMFAKDRPDKDEIASSGIRLEISTDDDKDMEFFNYYVESLEQLEKLKGSKVWEDAQQAFTN